MVLYVLLAVVVVLIILALGVPFYLYNRMITLRERVENAWSQIDVQLKRRHDLIPNLVETAKGYMEHERETLVNVTKARQQAVDASSISEQAEAENMLSGALRQLFAVTENYPELKADDNMQEVQEELTNTENKISFARQHYNDTTQTYNQTIQMVPYNILANMFQFREKDFFEIEDPAEREAPEVEF